MLFIVPFFILFFSDCLNMGSKIKYQIGGSYDPKGMNAAIKGINSLKDATKGFNKVVTALKATIVFKGVQKVLDGATTSFVAQNKALITFNKSVANNAKLTQQSLENLNKTLTKVSNNNFFDGDSLNYAASIASNMGLAENQIKNVMEAAADMASSGIMPLDQAVKSLSITYSGNLGQLKKLYPELGNITKQELEQGKAVDILADKYKGFSKEMANTFSGRNTQFKNSFGDLQASVGGIIQPVVYTLQQPLIDLMNKVSGWLVDSREYILKVVLNLPKVFELVGNKLKDAFSEDKVDDTFRILGEVLVNYMNAAMGVVVTIFESGFDMILEIGKTVGPKIGASLTEGIAADFEETMYNIVEGIANSPLGRMVGGVYGFVTGNDWYQMYDDWLEDIDNKVESLNTSADEQRSSAQSWATTSANISKIWKNAQKEVNTKTKNANANAASIIGQDTLDAFITEVGDALKTDLPEDLKQALGTIQPTGAGYSNIEGTGDDGGSEPDSIWSRFGQLANLLKNTSDVLDTFMESVLQAVLSISSIQAVLNPLNTILDGFMVYFEPLVNQLLAPLVGFLEILGEILGKSLVPIFESLQVLFEPLYSILAEVLNILQPIITLAISLIYTCLEPIVLILTPIIKLLEWVMQCITQLMTNVIFPVVQKIAEGIDWLFNCFIDALNGFIGWLNTLPFINIGTISRSNLSGTVNDLMTDFTSASLNNAGTDYLNSSSSSSGASYTGAKEIYINIYYDHSYVNGDAREIALNLMAEYKAAEALGY